MNPLASYKSQSNSKSRCSDFMAMAEQELSAYFNAVTQLFGSEQAEFSAEDWLRELIDIDSLPASTRELRLITARVLSRLASRVAASPLSAQLINA